MGDKIEKIGESLIQHGKFNDRIYLLKLKDKNVEILADQLDSLALKQGYKKIFAKISAEALPCFLIKGYIIEAFIPKFFRGSEDCIMVSKFYDKGRGTVPGAELKFFGKMISEARNTNKERMNYHPEYTSAELDQSDSVEISGIFKEVFETYPFPVHDPGYILETMKTGKAKYFGIHDGNKLIGVSTAEIDISEENAEMTDFAVLPQYRGKGLAYHLLLHMEDEMRAGGMKTCYTIARLKEPGMNKTFIKAGYKYAGTVVNNTNIGGSIESMNIFYKHV